MISGFAMFGYRNYMNAQVNNTDIIPKKKEDKDRKYYELID